MIRPDRKLLRYAISRANAARDERRFQDAATLYAEALRLGPENAAIHIQCGHMYKEVGQFDLAYDHYGRAEQLEPRNADLMLQIGHFHKVAGRPAMARDYYERALAAAPGWAAAQGELRALDEWASRIRTLGDEPANVVAENAASGDALPRMSAAQVAQLVPSLAPRPLDQLLVRHQEEVAVRRLGRREVTYWGHRQTLRGVEAIRGFCISATPMVEVEVYLGGLRIHKGTLAGGYDLRLEAEADRVKKYVFNLWIDFSEYPQGLHALELRFSDCNEAIRYHRDDVVIAEPPREADFPDSHHVVEVRPDGRRSLEDQIRSRPSMLRPAKRALFPEGVRSIALLRTDQLGDVVASIPAMQRMRELAPDARIVGIFTPANADLARTLPMLDEVILIDFPDDPLERRRTMPLDKQEELRLRLKPYAFDIAIDLAQAPVSRDLLRLTGAKFLYGTGGGDWPWLSADFQFHTPDRWTRHDSTPHSNNVLALVEALGATLRTSAPIFRRDDISYALIEAYGLRANEPYVLLHMGARIGFSRWPHYAELARLFLDRTDFKIVMMTEDPGMRETLPAELLADERVIYLDRRLPFDHFDAFVSYATVMTGNDSGPKHLASLRGTQVVTIFSARINWTEWGQENVGSIISRRLPCAGCALLHDPEECGRGFVCITDIRAEEVFGAMMALLDPPGAAG